VDSLVSNWAYMVMTSLAWTLKAWSALLLPVTPRHRESHEAARTTWLRMEFKTFVNEVLKVPYQIVRQGRRVIHRVLHWNPQLPTFFRLSTALNCWETPGRREKSPAPRAAFPSARRVPLDHRHTGSANHKTHPETTPPVITIAE